MKFSFSDNLQNMHARDFLDMQVALRNQREPRVFKQRMDPYDLSDYEFKRHFRFSKAAVEQLVEILEPDLIYHSNRGRPLSPFLKVCVALSHYGGGHFFRISALYGGFSKAACWQAVKQVTDSLVSKKAMFISMPSVLDMEQTSARMLERIKLPRFAMVGKILIHLCFMFNNVL